MTDTPIVRCLSNFRVRSPSTGFSFFMSNDAYLVLGFADKGYHFIQDLFAVCDK